jgi:hypothetical protein
MYIYRGQHRFRQPLDYRYGFYPVPSEASVRCPKCGARCRFAMDAVENFEKDNASGGYRLLNIPVEGPFSGRGTCSNCGHVFAAVEWPRDAYLLALVHGGVVWAWNLAYLPALRARVAGDRVLERQLVLGNSALQYFLSRLPKWAMVKRNRPTLLKTIDAWLETERVPAGKRPHNSSKADAASRRGSTQVLRSC